MTDAIIHTLGSGSSAEATIAGLNDHLARCEQYAQENEALADEVLRTYEQLNLIFDVTAQVAVLTDPYRVKRLLCERLRTSLNAQNVWCVGGCHAQEGFVPHDAEACTDCEVPSSLEEHIQKLADAVRADSRAIVQSLPSICSQASGERVYMMAGPLRQREGDDPLVMCAFRCRAQFASGDMLLFDSVLAYGGHVLRNLSLVERLKRTSFETVRALVSTIDKKDGYTCGHSERVGILARMTGREMGLAAEEVQELEWAGLLHDIGKIGIPESILNKPGKLTEEEYAVIKKHPQMSYDVLEPIAALASVMRTVIEHHESFDGTGYPKGLRGEEISLAGRIMHVVDVFDALTSNRAYRGAYDIEKALTILRQDAGTKLDPAVVDSFIRVLEQIEELRPAEFQELFPETCKEAGS